MAFVLAGHHVCIYDVNKQAVERVRKGEMPFLETDADRLLPEALATGRLTFSTEASSVGAAEIRCFSSWGRRWTSI